MSASQSSPRIQRNQEPPRFYFAHRNYLKFLLVDFKNRCGYSCQHMNRLGGLGGLEVDHFNPQLKQPQRNRYENLILSSRHCNGKKGAKWESPERQKIGFRFIDPTKETDYGVHIFEDPNTNELWGATPTGVYQIRHLDLNADHLVRERKRRSELAKLKLKPGIVTSKKSDPEVKKGIDSFNRELEEMIPILPQKTRPLRPWEH